MTTSRTLTFDYSVPPADVAALLQDPVYLRSRSESAGEHNIEVTVEPAPGGVQITVAREKDVDVPAFAKMVLGSARRAVESTFWRQSGDQWLAEYKIEVGGVPVNTKGRSTLAPSGSGCRYTTTFEVEAKIPLIGKRIEGFVADGLEEQLLENAKRNAAALAKGNLGPNSYINDLRDGVRKVEGG